MSTRSAGASANRNSKLGISIYTIKAYYKAIEYYLQAAVGNVGTHHQIILYVKQP